jgi:type II secretory ATPase GspE/PulE/Tfp pilus assembly ATPase PilB-like protein
VEDLVEYMYEAKGCDKCNNHGFVGRVPVYQYWKNGPDLKNVLLEGGSGSYNKIIDQVQEQGFRSLK